MDEKISLKAVDHYAQQYALHLVNSFFSKKTKISGPEILQLSAIKQVNLFVVRDLLTAWKKESEKLKSPYFDYDAREVSEAFVAFQNSLSNHILIGRQDFLPLLTKAVNQTIYLILDPYDFYSDILDEKEGSSLNTVDLKNDVKYIRINKAPLEKLVTRLEEKKLDSISGNEAFAILDHILEEVNFTPEEVEPHLQLFNQMIPLKVENFYEAKPLTPQAPVSKPETTVIANILRTATPTVQKEATKNTLADDLAKKKILRLKDNLTINQKFMFTKILFNGDFELFSAAVERLDELDTMSQAKAYLSNNYSEWNPESEEYQEFMEMVERRFA